MRVSLGTIDVDDDTRKAIRREQGGKGHATRNEIKDWALDKLNENMRSVAGGGGGEGQDEDISEERLRELKEASHSEYHPTGNEPGMPEPVAPNTGTGGTTPSTGQTTPTATGTTPGTT